jgi:predicted TPR repeat methyltransferase
MLEDRNNRVRWVYTSGGDPDELARRYDQWASSYDEDIEQYFGYPTPARIGELIVKYCPDRDAWLLDAGAGTGLVGRQLATLGFHNLVAIDLSEGMLAEAEKKNAYRELLQKVLGEPLGFETDSFDGVVSVGTLTLGHAPPSSLDELVRVTKPGGCIFFSMRPDVYEEHGFKEKQAALSVERLWEMVEVTDDFQGLPKGEPDAYVRIYVYRVL